MGIYQRVDSLGNPIGPKPHERPETAIVPVAELLAFEEKHPTHTGRKEGLIRTDLRIAPARYYQALNAAVRTPAALEQNPIVCHRVLDRIEQSRQYRRDRGIKRKPSTERNHS